MKFLAGLAELVHIHALHVNAGVFLDGIEDADFLVRSLEVDFHTLVHHGGLSVEVHGNLLKQILDEFHHPDIVLVSHIDFHAGKLRVVGLVHSFITEILCEFIYSVISAHDKSLEVEFIRNTQIQRNIQCIMMCDERSCGSASRN